MRIAAVVEVLRTEFPDLTVAKVRFLRDEFPPTAQDEDGKYSAAAIELLRRVLRYQRDEHLTPRSRNA